MTTDNDKWLEDSDVLPIFPTLLWKLQPESKRIKQINAQINKALNDACQGLPKLAQGESWQSSNQLHTLDELSDLRSCINQAVHGILKFMKIAYLDYEITGCWANINTKGSAHRMHSHPNNFLSGVYYVQTQSGADTINFHDPRIQTGIIRPPVTELTRDNTDQVVVRVKNGTLLIFPSYLQHSVDPNQSNERRISISFNVMFSSFTENLSPPLW